MPLHRLKSTFSATTVAEGLQKLAAAPALERLQRLAACTPTLHYRKNSLNRKLIQDCPSLTQEYSPTPWIYTGHLQTLAGTLLRQRYPVLYDREMLSFSDGGESALDWDSGLNNDTWWSKAEPYRRDFQADTPIMLVVPGLSGGSHSKYLRHFVLYMRRHGFRCVVSNYRGFAGVPARTPMVSTGADVSDMFDIVRHIKRRYPEAPLVGAGFSMGANILTKYLGVRGKCDRMLGAVSVSNAFDFPALSASLEAPLNRWLYSRPLAYMIKQNVFKNPKTQTELGKICAVDDALKASTIRQIDDIVCRKCYGLPSVDQYYAMSSSLPFVPTIDNPLLCLNAKDDPFAGQLPYADAATNENIILAVTQRGGHVNFTQGMNPFSMDSCWMAQVTKEYLQAVIKHAGTGKSAMEAANS